MPLYEYQCQSCGERSEVIQNLSDAPLEQCPKCNGGPVRKLMSAPAIQFKGSGFYKTDYASSSSSAPASSTSTPSTSSSTESSSASTPAATKSESKSSDTKSND